MPTFRSQQVDVEAVLYDGTNYDEVEALLGAAVERELGSGVVYIHHRSLDRKMILPVGFWAVAGLGGAYAGEPEWFPNVYELVT